jgi:hypothetical protein
MALPAAFRTDPTPPWTAGMLVLARLCNYTFLCAMACRAGHCVDRVRLTGMAGDVGRK